MKIIYNLRYYKKSFKSLNNFLLINDNEKYFNNLKYLLNYINNEIIKTNCNKFYVKKFSNNEIIIYLYENNFFIDENEYLIILNENDKIFNEIIKLLENNNFKQITNIKKDYEIYKNYKKL